MDCILQNGVTMSSKEGAAFAREVLALPYPKDIGRFEALAKERTANSGRLLLELVEHRRVWIRERALNALWEFGRKEDARRAARIGIQSKNFLVRDIAAEMMEEVGTTADVPALIEVLESEWWLVARASAASSLGELRTKAGVAALAVAVYDDPSWTVRAYAVQALCRTGDRRHLKFILERLEKEKEPAVWPSLYDAMIMMGQREYVEKLIDLLYDPDHWYMVYLRACVILQVLFIEEGKPLPDRAIKGLRRVLKYDVGKAAKWSARDLLKEVGITVRVPR